ncbi:F-type H+-transporting ATPase subunit gamma [Chitinophaga terrae (ex Kim and Jung 2007)]|uniref:ATP synthase gamma chain n=1 Tax=Chitinophaga terrae (ex Kim and Jung 2007) TaxID=408074 RepID=A0A1H4FCH6_9BACT|nr:ATP synthase F1 subunit gamma [Chitinophaga terrae (ex Kim and Jung 2007)]MDQ0110312.1 F-type H+-transporting ATPase subunit gamma [Chitinophaga terrae (ex Kim and Jung 2007)]GEP92435.1 ATP synthase gamma chain [Chitinophaga terrae (ex Kim and Jung 2007)]SEA95029.1 F-type H+-transporting ATPase subunit gamma [Chitinophaga terrae (ex Kim and Jung 2007)]
MSGQLKEVRNRIKSIQSGQQITKAMKMVSAAKLRRAQDAIMLMRPYAVKLQEMLQNIVSNSEGNIDTPLAAQRQVEKVLVVVITSDRGLCGAFNSNLIKTAKRLIREKYQEQFEKGNVEILPIGKKGYEHFLQNGYKVNDKFWHLFSSLTFDNVKEAAAVALNGFIDGTYDAVDIVYSEFKNAATQVFVTEQFLPIAKVESTDKSGLKADYIFEPEKDTLIAELMPKILNTQFFKAMLDSNASEHGARMTAMDKATENASELLRNLKISYNRARQAAITTELTEIVSGAAALAG